MAISTLGVGSGLDLSSLLKNLVSAERAPAENRLNAKEESLNVRLSAFGSVKSSLASVQTAVSKLSSLDKTYKATSSDTAVVDATASTTASAGNYTIEVGQLAKAHAVASLGVDGKDDVIGTGKLTIQVGSGDAVEIDVDSENNTLTGIRDAINAADAGVTASVVNDGSGWRLLMTADETGAANTISVGVADDDGNHADVDGLSRLASANLEQTVEAKDANVTINGLAITSASNTLDESVDGLSITLKNETGDTPVTVSVAMNSSAIKDAIAGFVGSYNAAITMMSGYGKVDPSGETQNGPLVGDSTLRSVRNSLSSALLTNGGNEDSQYRNLINLGIKSLEGGRLSIDDATLDEAIAEDVDGVMSLLNDFGDQFETVVKGFAESGGLLDSRSEGIRASLRSISAQREALDDRITRFEDRLSRQFTALDVMLGQMQQTSDYLTQQLSALSSFQ
ncbi:MAG: flagellar filament capping protein FliD [Ectothiorhodospiraceae bacterium]|jgi:flagellar hook-associated protein 2|nr:flagellar filament capping protein FliD [Ectothiorhodospiraceae bacterium]